MSRSGVQIPPSAPVLYYKGFVRVRHKYAPFTSRNRQEGLRLQEEFVAEFRKAYREKDHCPCQKACRYHGNCKECVAIHRAHQEHVPNCMRPILNSKIKVLSELKEHTIANEIEPPHEILRKEFQND